MFILLRTQQEQRLYEDRDHGLGDDLQDDRHEDDVDGALQGLRCQQAFRR